jgi:integrase
MRHHGIGDLDPIGPTKAGIGDLTAADVETLRHVVRGGMGQNSLRALRSDLGYLEAWSLAATGRHLAWPPGTDDLLRFIAHHLWDPAERARSPDHGMPEPVRCRLHALGILRSDGPHAPATVRRRLASWRTICRWKGHDGPFGDPKVSRTLNAAIRLSDRPRRRHSARLVDRELIVELLDHLDDVAAAARARDREGRGVRLRALRDRALVATMFASGGRRRSEISALRADRVLRLPPIEAEETEIASMALDLGRTKTTDGADASRVFLSGRAAEALEAWLGEAAIAVGPVFPGIDRWGHVGLDAITPAAVNGILKARLAGIGRDPRDFSAHGVRAGYITSALKAGIPAPEVMEQTLHRSLDTLMSYFKDERQREGRAARLL